MFKTTIYKWLLDIILGTIILNKYKSNELKAFSNKFTKLVFKKICTMPMYLFLKVM